MHEFEYEKRLMGTEFSVSIIADCTREQADAMYRTMSELGDLYEATFSRFREDSELSQLNARKQLRVSPLFIGVLDVARHLFDATGGAFNPLVQIKRFGYTKDFASLPHDMMLSAPDEPYDIDFNAIGIDRRTGIVTLREGQQLDFGGFLKGLVAERMTSWAEGVQGVIVNIGGDIATLGRDIDRVPFEFSVWDPIHKRDIPLPVENASIATSGTYKRTWKLDGMPVSHILGDDGHAPNTDLVSATVVAHNGAEAEGFATMALISGSRAAQDMLSTRGLPYLLIDRNGAILSSYAV